jgi:tetratricopeptide (TPR) repeat protein
MKVKLNYLLCICFLCAISASAQTAKDTLKQCMAALQSNPDDIAQREKIISLSFRIKPKLTVSDEAREKFVMGMTLRETKDYGLAIPQFKAALLMAPWWSDAYKQYGLTLEFAEKFDDAIVAFQLYIKTQPGAEMVTNTKDEISILKAKKMKADIQKAESDKIARVEEAKRQAEEVKRQAEQAKRDVINKIKNAVSSRNYQYKPIGHTNVSWDGGANDYEMFGGGTYYLFNFDFWVPIYWKFFDDHVELWGHVDPVGGTPREEILLRGESTGPNMSDMKWFQVNTVSFEKGMQVWALFDPQNGYLYTTANGWSMRPVNDSEFDANKRYNYVIYKPVN